MKRDLTLTFELLKQLITQYPTLAAAQDIDGWTSLHWLSSNVFGPADLAEQLLGLLLQAGASLEARHHGGVTPLKVAVYEDNAMVVQLLLQAGAKVDPPPALSGRNVLHLAALFAGQDTLNILADANIRGLDVDAVDEDGDTPLNCWRWRKYADSNHLFAGTTRPTVEDDHAFEALLQGVRDRTFQADIELCNLVLQAAKDEDYISARELLEPAQNNEAGHHIYRGCSALRTNILLQLKSGMWETAIAELEDMIETRRQRMMHSPFREESNHYYADDSSSSSEDDEGEGAEDDDSVGDSSSAVQDQIVEEMELANGAPMESPKGV
ncbi:putative ankyrin repeat protein [Phaeoacremonium minimum UCRPA7]|uniref:Putative ankyrin repeat protein n=1 Tax=Phaeoacremonium minimum (strain UCR-PA7) TaxID=1286976 RepID=R8BPL5_PHAM7|nr:putative ankyrin repeat protein [Phaeoacremonium minimum UCRPA7]EOO01279.1 putative ankyrin repeat protein [Phaeoacremonium minimum UCRPA7]